MDPTLAFILGWACCCGFIGLAEWLTDIREESLSDPMAEPHGDCCPWPQDFKSHSFHSASVDERAQQDHGSR